MAIIPIGTSVILTLIKSSYGKDKALKIEIENNKILIKKLNNKIKYVLDENNIEKIIVEGILHNLKFFGPINTLNNNRARIQLKNRKCIVLKFAFLF